MPTNSDQLTFEASAYLQTLIGRELFRHSEAAVVELVKNAYDSGATLVTITIRPRSEREPGEIIVSDDGEGMSLARFRKLFMFAGYSERPDQVSTADRVPTGEKGIGRFASDRIGTELAVVTKERGASRGLSVRIDWTKFSNRKRKFHDIRVPYERVSVPGMRKDQGGTTLTITRLRERWDSTRIKRLRNTLTQLLHPFRAPSAFTMVVNVDRSATLSGPIEQPTIQDPDLELRFDVLASGKVQRRWKLDGKTVGRDTISIAADAAAVAGVKGRLFYYLKRPTKSQTSGISPGVKLYRDGFRVDPVGSESNDWLGVSEKRAKRAGHAHIVPTRLFGFVSISRRDHGSIQDTTSREALLETAEAQALVSVLRKLLESLEDRIRSEFTEPRWKESRIRKAAALERERLHSLSILSVGIAHELRQPMQTIRSEAENIESRLKSLGVEDAHIVEAQVQIDRNIDRMDKNIKVIAALSAGNLDEAEEVDLAEVVRDHSSLLQHRCSTLGITMEINVPDTQRAILSVAAVTMALLNVLNNAMDALKEVEDDRELRISVSLSQRQGSHIIEVSDNANGIPKEIQGRIFKKFASKKTGGMGVGLRNSREIVRSRNGDITFETRDGVGTRFRITLPDQE